MPDVTTKCVVYCRVSTQEQVTNLSLETQQKQCEAFARSKGWSVVEVFVEEGESAKTTNRPALQQLLGYCRHNRGQVQYAIVYSLSRFSRNTGDHLALRARLAALGIQLRSVTEPLEDGSTGRFVETLFAAIAQLDNDVRAERTSAGMKAAVERGRWPHRAPLGYRNARDANGRAVLELDEDRADHIRQAFLWTAEGRSQAEIRAALSMRGLKTRNGRLLAPQTLSKLLRNPIYMGRIRSRAWKVESKGEFPALVDEATFLAANAMLGGKAMGRVHLRQRPAFPLKHFVRCGACQQRPLSAYWAKGRGRRYAYYECPACRLRTGRDDLEDAFLLLLEELRPRPEFLRLFRAVVLDVWNARRTDALVTAKELLRRGDEVRDRRVKLVEAFVYQKVPKDRSLFEEMTARLDAELAEIEAERARTQVEELDAAALVDYAVQVVTRAGKLWRDANHEQRVKLQAFLFPAGLRWTGKVFVRTAATGPLFYDLAVDSPPASSVATLAGFEPAIFTLKG